MLLKLQNGVVKYDSIAVLYVGQCAQICLALVVWSLFQRTRIHALCSVTTFCVITTHTLCPNQSHRSPVASQLSADGMVVWINVSLPALGYTEYSLVDARQAHDPYATSKTIVSHVRIPQRGSLTESVVLANEYIRLYFNTTSAKLHRMGALEGSTWVNRTLTQSFFIYKSNDTQAFEAPDAYVFWPEAGPPLKLQQPTITLHRGVLVNEVGLLVVTDYAGRVFAR